MQRAVTAIYRSYANATLVRQELERLGLGRHHVTILPDADVTSRSDRTSADLEDAFDRLHDLNLPESDTRTYQHALRNGDYVVSVSADEDADLARIQEVMRRPEDAYDLDELNSRYSTADYAPRRQPGGMAAGASGRAESAASTATTGLGSDLAATGTVGGRQSSNDGTVEVVEENLTVGKRDVDRGAVRVHSYVREEPVSADLDLRSTHVFVERRPVDRPVAPGEEGLPEQVIEAHEHREEAVVAKDARVVEEIGLRTDTETSQKHVEDTVRKTEVELEDTRTGEASRVKGNDKDRGRF